MEGCGGFRWSSFFCWALCFVIALFFLILEQCILGSTFNKLVNHYIYSSSKLEIVLFVRAGGEYIRTLMSTHTTIKISHI